MSRLRQVVLVANDLEKTTGALTSLLDSYVTHRDPHVGVFGVNNTLIPVGNGTFIEVISPFESHTASSRFLSKQGEGGYMILVQVNGVQGMSAAMEASEEMEWIHKGSMNVDLEPCDFSDQAPGFNGSGISGFHLHPREVGCIAELTLQHPRSHWLWAGNDWLTADERTRIAHGPCGGLAGVEIHVSSIGFRNVIDSWVKLLQIKELTEISAGVVDIVLDNDSFLRLVSSKISKGVQELFIYSTKMPHGSCEKVAGLDICFVDPLSEVVSKL